MLLKLLFQDHLGNKTVSHYLPFSRGAEHTLSQWLPWDMLMLSSFENPVILTWMPKVIFVRGGGLLHAYQGRGEPRFLFSLAAGEVDFQHPPKLGPS